MPTAREYPRTFVPAEIDLGRWEEVEPLFAALLARPLDSPLELERWLLEMSELAAALSEERARRYIAMTSQTDDPERAARYRAFIEEIDPRSEPFWHELDLKYLTCPHRAALPAERYGVLDRAVASTAALFRPQNVPLQVEETLLGQRHASIQGAMTVMFRGEERTLPQMKSLLEEPDRCLREEAWRAASVRRLADAEAIEELFDRLLELRHRIAVNAGFDSYLGYRFCELLRFDYGVEECRRFHDAVAAVAVPLRRRLLERRKLELGLERLRPWDLAVDPQGRPPLKPFSRASELLATIPRVLAKVHNGFGEAFSRIIADGGLDLESRKGKAPGGYQQVLDEIRRPFIFINAVGLDDDVRTLLHEAGHAIHALACRDQALLAYRHAPIEFAEVASMAMELLGGDHLDLLYLPGDFARSRRNQLEHIVHLFTWVATIDAFQHWLYTHPGHSRADRRQAWLDAFSRFDGGVVDWSGLEEEQATRWQQQLHLFQVPLYYIEYGIAQLGALGVWRNVRRDARWGVDSFRQALSLGGSQPLPRLFEAAGLRFDFGEETLRPLLEDVMAQIEELECATHGPS